uniref:hypothetical protein n=1 Tax=Halomonas sp. TaxID=1486246 RepID=UPI002610E5C9|nr:hypothetical protein [Halomonas sp.]
MPDTIHQHRVSTTFMGGAGAGRNDRAVSGYWQGYFWYWFSTGVPAACPDRKD